MVKLQQYDADMMHAWKEICDITRKGKVDFYLSLLLLSMHKTKANKMYCYFHVIYHALLMFFAIFFLNLRALKIAIRSC